MGALTGFGSWGLIVVKSIGAATADPDFEVGNGLHIQFESQPVESFALVSHRPFRQRLYVVNRCRLLRTSMLYSPYSDKSSGVQRILP